MRLSTRLLGPCLLLAATAAGAMAQPAPRPSPPAQPPRPAAPPAEQPAAARLDGETFPGAAWTETLLHVERPGRFAIRAQSATGTGLQLVDMATGPGDLAGVPGIQDGRLDLLLDTGTYKLRLLGAETGAAPVRVTVEPFLEAAAPAPLRPGQEVGGALADLQQRSHWFTVDTQRRVRIEATGRALGDLRLWREGRDLVATDARAGQIEPTPGHTVARRLLTPVLEPGTYRVTAYGGPPLTWADGNAALPFELRLDGSRALDEGWVSGTIGASGSAVFDVTSQAEAFRLTLPAPATASLAIATGDAGSQTAALAPGNREPTLLLRVGARQDQPRRVVVSGREGQSFQLRAFGGLNQPEGDWRLAEAIGFGGDEVPPTLLLARQPRNGPMTTLASVGPRIGPGAAWRARFNLRGPSSFHVEVTAPGPVALRTQGVALSADITPLAQGGQPIPRADGENPPAWNLAAGWYLVRLAPRAGGQGVLDVTIGPPGLQPADPSPPLPADPVLVLGRFPTSAEEPIRLFANTLPGGRVTLISRTLPLDPGAGALIVTQRAGEALALPLAPMPAGELAVTELGGAALTIRPQPGRTPAEPAQLRLPAPAAARSLMLARRAPQPPAIMPVPRPLPALPALAAGRPLFFDLARDQQRSFALSLPEGGLYRIETLGRLRTRGTLNTAFIAPLDEAAGNGVGENMLIQRHLRAGAYRLTVTAENSNGRLGLLARPAPTQTAPVLRPDGTVRATLAAGHGLAIPIEIAERGLYRLNLLALGRDVQARLEDAEGWPFWAPGPIDGLEQDLPAGRYRLVVTPVDIDSRIVTRLTPLRAPLPTEGHGPHPLVFGATAANEWREPAARDAPRDPDLWDFTLAGDAQVTLAITDGMGAELHRDGGAERVAAFADGADFRGTLPAGRYRISARALGRNDRLPYRLTLRSNELQPDVPRQVNLPYSLPFAIAEERVVNLTSFGPTLLRATLRDAEGRILLREGERTDDWNFALSRQLPAGRYSLELAQPVAIAPYRAPQQEVSDSGDDEPDADPRPGNTADDDPSSDGPAADAGATSIRLSLPEPLPAQPVAAEGETVLDGAGVHHLTLPAAPAGSLILAAAEASEELVLTLDRQIAGGPWQPVAIQRGTRAVAAVPAEPGASWRASVWRVDGGSAPIRFALRTPVLPAQPLGTVTPVPAGIGDGLHLALVAAPGAALVTVPGEGLRQASAPGAGSAPVAGGLVAPQSERLWLLAPGPAPLQVAAAAAGRPLVVTLAAGETATLPAGDGPARLWLAQSGADTAALEAGRGMGLARGSSLVLAGGPWLRLRNAEGAAPIRAALRAIDPALVPERAVADAFREPLAANTAQPLRLPDGPKRVRLDLAPGTAAVLGWRDAGAVTVWAGDAAVSRQIDGDWTSLLLVNTGAAPAPAMAQIARLDGAAAALRPAAPSESGTSDPSGHRTFRRFFGAAGSIALPVEAAPGQRLRIAGARAATLIARDGGVQRGADLRAAGPGLLVLEHGPGPILAWLGDAAPFPAAPAQPAPLPGHWVLSGPTMALTLSPATPVLLQARTTAPVVLALGDATPEVFAAGAEFQHYIPAGETVLRVMAPQDGPLSGALELDAVPVLPAVEGVGSPVMVAPGGSALFGFELARAGLIGLGVRAEPDRVAVRLLGADGAAIGDGVAQLRRLPAGRYIIEARLPADAGPAAVRPAVIGIEPRPSGPPAEVARAYQAMTGVTPVAAPAAQR
ncbi:MAG TPA: hypothetical protein VGM87_05855 [Roseomonas sp.]|jgi:hypothetical protein